MPLRQIAAATQQRRALRFRRYDATPEARYALRR